MITCWVLLLVEFSWVELNSTPKKGIFVDCIIDLSAESRTAGENSRSISGFSICKSKLEKILTSEIFLQVFVASRLNVPGAWQMPQVLCLLLKFQWGESNAIKCPCIICSNR